jgi:single-strand DNA-binding protein
LNDVTFIGNLTNDPELRFTPGGRAVANFGFAVNRSYTDKAGNKVEKPTYFQVSVWGDMAENVAGSLHKGNRAMIQGYLETEDWNDREGNKRTTVRITANEVAPSLRWATAQVSRTSGSGSGSAPGAPTPSDTYAADQGHFGAPASTDEPF